MTWRDEKIEKIATDKCQWPRQETKRPSSVGNSRKVGRGNEADAPLFLVIKKKVNRHGVLGASDSKSIVAERLGDNPFSAEPTGHGEMIKNPGIIIVLHIVKIQNDDADDWNGASRHDVDCVGSVLPIFGRIRVVAVTVLVTDFPVAPMDHDFGFLLNSNFSCPLDGGLLGDVVGRVLFGIVASDSPPLVAFNYVLIWHTRAYVSRMWLTVKREF